MTRPAQSHRLSRLSQTYHVGGDGLPTHLITQATVTALDTEVTTLAYVFDTEHIYVQGVSGCVASAIRPDDYDKRYWAVDLTLDKPLPPGQARVIEYHTFFSYPTLPPCELQQGSGPHGADHVELTVRFAPEASPKHAQWDKRDGLEADSRVIDSQQTDVTITDPNDMSAGFVISHVWTNLPPGQMVGLYWNA